MKAEQGYNGYSNRETWALELWLSNDEGFYREIREEIIPQLRKRYDDEDLPYRLADRLKDWVENELKEFAEESKSGSQIRIMFDDIGSLWRIDWQEIAACWLED
jgi:hypothetical protein